MKKLNYDKGSTERFGYAWIKFNEIRPDYEKQFLKWIHPLEKTDFKNKTVLDGGCGVGRNSFWPLKYNSKKVVAFDYDKNTVAIAKRNLKNFKNCEVFFKSIYDIDYKDKFDIAFSIGVIHHLEFPKKAVKKLVEATKPGGMILVWVYGYEGNEWIVRYINPLRKITSRLPLKLMYALTHLFSAPLYIYLRLINQKNEYLKQISKFKFWHLHSITLDQLIPRIANYWRKEEALELFNNTHLKDLKIFRVNNNSWTVIATKK